MPMSASAAASASGASLASPPRTDVEARTKTKQVSTLAFVRLCTVVPFAASESASCSRVFVWRPGAAFKDTSVTGVSLPPRYVQHLVHPRGLGDLDEPHAAGEVGSMVGGLGVRVTLHYRNGEGVNPTIDALAGRAFGNPALIPPLSYLAEVVVGMPWDAAGRMTPESIVEGLSDGDRSSLPESVHRAAGFAHGALQRALGISTEGPPADINGPGVLVCRCIGVGDRTVRDAIRNGARTPDEIGEESRACTGCRSCRPDLLGLLDEELRPPWPDPDPALSPIAQIAWARGGPLLRSLGLPLQTVRENGRGLRITLGPAAPDALTTMLGAAAQVRYVLRETTGIELEVLAEGS